MSKEIAAHDEEADPLEEDAVYHREITAKGSSGNRWDGYRLSPWLFFIGVVIAVACVQLGYVVQDTLQNTSLEAMRNKPADMGLFFVFAFGTPLGFALMVISALWFSAKRSSNLGLYVVTALFLLSFPVLVPHAFGRSISGAYFGTGGYIILTCVIISFWFWMKYRSALTTSYKAAADLQAMGYLCFALAAWNLCGFGAAPSFALYPEKMLQHGSQPFAIGQLKAIMAYFVCAWVFTAAGMYKSFRLKRYRQQK
ncbi:MAG: hypothetical protein OEZ68_14420 [Gammaproteobacteria bacterium]|nr:hypothetical protein [Gammaproteobacteria bacterium]MDH5801998.1 hypothetical protein [Gammaproteobacteria bacterium]